jgi:two-component system cell cycle response regulator DivK
MSRTAVIVEDNHLNRRLFAEVLKGAGFAVEAVADGRELLDIVRAERPKVVLMDLQLPYISGFELIRRLRADPETAAVPLIAISGFVRSEDEQSARLAGADLFLAKPVDTVLLRDAACRLADEERRIVA